MARDSGFIPLNFNPVCFELDDSEFFISDSDGIAMENLFIVKEGKLSEKDKYAIFLRKNDYGKFSFVEDRNLHLLHELSHINYDAYVHNGMTENEDVHRISETFARTMELYSDRLADALLKNAFSPSYPIGTGILVHKSFHIYRAVGKKAMTSILYRTTPEKFGQTLIDRIYDEEEVLKAAGVLSAMQGGSVVGRILNEKGPDYLVGEARMVYDKIAKSSSQVSERDLMLKHLAEEFSLGRNFAEAYLREVKPSSLEELIMGKGNREFEAIINASALKWVWAHAATDMPDYERGFALMEHFMRTLSSIYEVTELGYSAVIQPAVMRAYADFFGSGNMLSEKLIKSQIEFRHLDAILSHFIIPEIINSKTKKE
jgi:hypothetical protein